MKIDKLETPSGEDIFYEDDFRITLESHIPYFKERSDTTVETIDNLKPIKYNGSFFDVLDSLNVPKQYHWFIMRLNGLKSPYDMDPGLVSFLAPSLSEIERIKNTYLTRKTNS